jgi:hypothetical protein
MNIPSTLRAVVAIALSLLVGAALASAPAAGKPIVGEVTLVIGPVFVQAGDGARQPVQRGAEVRLGDRMETEVGGHVHLRFVDGARVSVRPASRIVIQDYADPSRSGGIRFSLETGVVRSITGRWGEADKQRFRLNTPVAAIGVKGTDFVVRADSSVTQASVFAGEIVLSPLSSGCVGSFGPCLNGREKSLAADAGRTMIELRRDEAVPQFVPAVDLLSGVKRSAGSGKLASESAASRQPTSAASTTAVAQGGDQAAPPLPVVSERAGDAARPETLVAQATSPAMPVQTSELRVDSVAAQTMQTAPTGEGKRDLVWGRYAWAPVVATDDFSVKFSQAVAAGHERVGSDGAFVLLRPLDGTTFSPAKAKAEFLLESAMATVVGKRGVVTESVKVEGGSLSVDFAKSSFATSLQTRASLSGAQLVQASGAITADGRMDVQSSNSQLQGAFNNSGTQAGYVFRKTLPDGILMGTTLWGR